MRDFAIVATLLVVAAPAFAQEREAASTGYVSGGFSYLMPKNLRTSVGVQGGIDDGFGVMLAFGRRFGALRGEIEGSYREAKVGDVTGFGLAVPGAGRLSAISAMANLFIDPAFRLGPLQPYLGGGVGVARFRARDVSAIGLPILPPVTSIGSISGSATGFAYQAMAGVGIATGDKGAITVGYRYYATPSLTTDVPLLGDVKINGLRVHSVEAGFRMNF